LRERVRTQSLWQRRTFKEGGPAKEGWKKGQNLIQGGKGEKDLKKFVPRDKGQMAL